jgi:hypothetical protein
MARQAFLMLGCGLALVLSSNARADKFPAMPPQPKLFSSVYGSYALKILPDVSSVGTRKRTEGVHSAAQAGQIVGNSEGVFFALDENAKEKVIWRAKLVNSPNRAILVENGKYVVTLDSWRNVGFDHCLVVYGEKGKVIADFKLEDLLTAKEIEGLPTEITTRDWSSKDIAEFEDRSREDELVIRMKYKGWTKVIRLTLSSGRIVKESTDVGDLAPPKIRILAGARTTASDMRFFSFSCEASNSNKAPLMFVGYRADSFAPPIADGNMSPIHVIQFQHDGKWKEHPQGWCGTGIDGILLPAGRTKKFGFAVPADLAGKVVRVGIRWSRPQDFAVAKPESFRVAWSEPFELKRIDEARPELQRHLFSPGQGIQ